MILINWPGGKTGIRQVWGRFALRQRTVPGSPQHETAPGRFALDLRRPSADNGFLPGRLEHGAWLATRIIRAAGGLQRAFAARGLRVFFPAGPCLGPAASRPQTSVLVPALFVRRQLQPSSYRMPVALITPESVLHIRGPWVEILERAGFTIAYPEEPTFTRGLCSAAETIRVLKPASAVIAGGEYFTPEILAGLPNLRVIARAGVGYDRVDVPESTKRKIAVTITPTANHEGVAEQAFALIFAFAKNVVVNDHRTRTGQWSLGTTRPLRGNTLGLVGLGRIGRSTALRGRAMGMHVLAAETYPNREFARQHGVELVNLDTLLARSDYVSLHCPHNAETHHLFNAKTFAKMKAGSVLINTSRGKLVCEQDLLAALKSGHLAGAGLDVFEHEPAGSDNPLFALPNVIVSPHLGGADKLSQDNSG